MSSLPHKSSRQELPPLRPLEARQSLTHECVEQLKAQIVAGKLAPGARLPTEQEMIAAMGVSRTVVREAVAALRAEGLVETRQGVGAFVASNARRPFRIEFEGLASLGEVLQVMELRTGVEIEAAGLAAERATPAQIERIGAAFDAVNDALDSEEGAVDEDFAFHHSISEAAGNPQFPRFLEYLGRFIIPRQSVRVTLERPGRRAYLVRIQEEHAEILAAIRDHAVAPARAAMRRHLLNSRKRYRKLAEQSRQG